MTSPPSSHFESPPQIGPFRIVSILGVGGMGTVYLGERRELFSQRVAIKVLHAKATDDASTALSSEGHVLMSLDHAHIVRLLDRGVSQEGLRYLVMEYVEGLPIDEFCDQQRLSVRDRIELLLKAMDAVDYAHRHLVVHSDLKPANILVTADGEPKLLDFGIAAMLPERRSHHAEVAFVSDGYTASFASPEQRAGKRLTVGSDVYTLGVVANILLTGLNPARGLSRQDSLSATSALKKVDAVKLTEIAEARSTSPTGLIAALDGDLDSILAKARRRDPDERFQNMEEFSADLRLYLDGRPITARRTSGIDRTHKWIRRHRLAVTLSAILLSAVILSTVGVAWQTAHAARQRRIAQTRLHDLVRLTGVLEGELYDSVNPLPHAAEAKSSLIQGASETLDSLAADDSQDAVLTMQLAQQYEKLARLQMAQADPAMWRRALEDAAKAVDLLRKISRSDADYAEAQRQIAELTVLEQQISSR